MLNKINSLKISFIILIVTVSFENYSFSQSQILIQAETADTINTGTVDSNNIGFTGSGFVNFVNALGTYAVWNFNLPSAGRYTITVRFANGSTPRTMDIFVNNIRVIENFNFPSTDSFTIWHNISFQSDFVNGLNKLKFVGSNPNGGPNLDYFTISSNTVNLQEPPIVINDTFQVPKLVFSIIDPLLNDYDVNGDTLRIVSWQNPLHGIIDTIQGGTKFNYKPDLNFTGKDSFEYVVSDGIVGSSAKIIIHVADIDWSVKMADMIVTTKLTNINWDYTVGLMLEGVLRVYKRTHDPKYLDFINEWAQYHISADGTISRELDKLDNMMPGYLILHLYELTGIERYKLAADKIRNRFDTYPRNADSCLWHTTTYEGQLWLDGLYMSMPFLATYGNMFAKEDYAYTSVIREFNLQMRYLLDNETGLLHHAYDVDGSSFWAEPPYNRAPYSWGRANGWAVMALEEVLDIIPAEFPGRDTILNKYISVLKSLATYQDSSTGLWYQIIDKGNLSGNWLETSCSMMFIYAMERAIQKGFLEESYRNTVELGYQGVLTQISEGTNNMVYLKNICGGTSCSNDINFYFNRPRNTNDNHGLGSFLIMNELIAYNNNAWVPVTVPKTTSGYVSVFPNPCGDYTELKASSLDGSIKIDIYNISGMKVKTIFSSGQSESISINMSGMVKGMYLLRIQSDNKIITEKLIKQ